MKIFSLLDFYPCGAYKLTNTGEHSMCQLYNNVSLIGAGNNKLNQLLKWLLCPTHTSTCIKI